MGDLAGLTARDRQDAKRAAQRIIDAVVNDNGNPAGTLIGQAGQIGVPTETLVLWLAQLALEAP